MVPHSWGRWNVVANPGPESGNGGMEAVCSVCEYPKTKIDKDDDGGADHWTKDTALVTVKNGRATRMIVKPGDKIKLYPDDKAGQKAIGWKVEYRREYNTSDSMAPVQKNWDASAAESLFNLVTNGSALEWGCTIPAFSAMGAPGGGQFFFEPVYAGCDHSGGTTVLNAKAQVCDRKGYTGDKACVDCGHIISAGSDIYPPANAGHTGPLQPLYYYGTNPSATTDASHGGKRYNARSGDCWHRAYEGDYRCTACGGTVKGESGDFKHSGPFELRDERAATCTEKGYSGNQYCTVCNKIAVKGSPTPSLHEIEANWKLVNKDEPSCTAAGYSGDQQCTRGCGQIFRYGHVLNKLGHEWDGGSPKTQGKSEGMLYTCQRAGCGETKFVKSGELSQPIGAVKLTVPAPVKGAAPEIATTSDTTYRVADTAWEPTVSGTFAGGTQYTVAVSLEAIGSNRFTDATTFQINGQTATPITEIPAAGVDNTKITLAFPATEDSSSGGGSGGSGGSGVTTYAITVKSAKNGDVTASHKSASKGTTVTLTVDPDKGYVLDTLTVLDGKGKEIKLTEKNGKYTFTMPASKVTVEAMFEAEQSTGNNPFIDVPAGSYYEDAVIWAVDKGITTGTSATTFNPDGICTRAQAVTFLWRAAGSPAPETRAMPFADVKAGSYYYDAVLWAVEQGITKGTSATMFSPDATCTRAQIVTFLWRAGGSPAVSGNSAFTDVAADAYYAAAVTWAEKNDITGGIGGGLFGSDNNCTRAQIVTFIWRSVK